MNDQVDLVVPDTTEDVIAFRAKINPKNVFDVCKHVMVFVFYRTSIDILMLVFVLMSAADLQWSFVYVFWSVWMFRICPWFILVFWNFVLVCFHWLCCCSGICLCWFLYTPLWFQLFEDFWLLISEKITLITWLSSICLT